MSSDLGYYRHPTVFGKHVVFVSDDDLWAAATDPEEAGYGSARRLTANPGISAFPRFSPDGRTVAFTGRDDGPAEVYVMAADGGAPRRLTWFGATTQVIGWNRGGDAVLAASDWRQPFAGSLHTVEAPLDGRPPRPLPYGPARAIAFRPRSGGVVIGRNSGDPARWKRYRGGTAGTLWIDADGTGNFRELLRLDGNLASPMWIGARIYFLSDHEGHGNIYSCTPLGRRLKRHTHHDRFYVRFPSTDGTRIVYHAGADLYVFDPRSDESRKIETRIRSSRSQRVRRFVDPVGFMESFDLHPDGHSIAAIIRGGLFGMGLWEGAPVRYGPASAVRCRLGSWLPDGKRIVAVTDAGGDERLVVFAADGASAPRTIAGDFGRPISLHVAPGDALSPPDTGGRKTARKAGRSRRRRDAARRTRIVLTNHRHEIILVDLDSGRSRVLDRSPHHRIHGAAWSPDSRWVAYGYASSYRTARIRLREVDTGRSVDIVRQEDFLDGYPAFDPDGRYLYFISWRSFNPVYDSLYFDLGFPKGARPYLVPLRSETVSPFESATRPPLAPGAGGEREGGDDGKPEPFRIDAAGIERRITAFPVPEGRYRRILGARGRALFLRFPVVGSLGGDDDASVDGVLEHWDFRRNKTGRTADKVTDFGLSLDANVLAMLAGDRVRAVGADFEDDSEKSKDEYGRETGWVDLDRIPVAVIPSLEWTQMYDEAWRLQRDHFWHPDMSGTDWMGIRERYRPLLERVGTRAEFSDLMWEMQGELGTSHCYELGGDYRSPPNWRQGFLGADLALAPRRRAWRIERIPEGDAWDPAARSPLAAPGVDLAPGDEILAIGDEPVGGGTSPDELLVNMADRNVRIRVRRRRGRRSTTGTVTVRAIAGETALRYRDWVEGNRRRVHERTRGRVGYVHLPDMGPAGYAEFHRYFGPESERDGLIVDVRFNRGGHVSQLLLEKLLRLRIGYDVSRWAEPVPYPDAAPMGPMVALTNEYAGSDGDIFCHAFKLLGLGPLLGKRTWGGVVGIWPRAALVDGTVTTQPEFAYWFEDVGYAVENYGTDPDIEIDVGPGDHAAGRDPQLERAMDEVVRIIRKERPRRPDLGPSARGKPRKKR